MFHIGLVESATRVVNGDEVIVGGRDEFIGARKGLRGGLHWLLDNNRDFVRVEDDEIGHGFGIIVLASGDDAAFSDFLGNDLDLFAPMNGLVIDDFWSFDVVAKAVAFLERLPNDGVANGHFEFGLVGFLGHGKAGEAEDHKGNKCLFHINVS